MKGYTKVKGETARIHAETVKVYIEKIREERKQKLKKWGYSYFKSNRIQKHWWQRGIFCPPEVFVSEDTFWDEFFKNGRVWFEIQKEDVLSFSYIAPEVCSGFAFTRADRFTRWLNHLPDTMNYAKCTLATLDVHDKALLDSEEYGHMVAWAKKIGE